MREEKRFTHKQLEEVGAKWLARCGYWWSCKRIAIEPASASPGSERPDVIGFSSFLKGSTHVIECKTTRGDFLRDFRKKWRTEGEKPMGSYRWWLCEWGVITFADVNGSADGLLWVTATGHVHIARYPFRRSKEERNVSGELSVLYTMLNKEAEKPITIYL